MIENFLQLFQFLELLKTTKNDTYSVLCLWHSFKWSVKKCLLLQADLKYKKIYYIVINSNVQYFSIVFVGSRNCKKSLEGCSQKNFEQNQEQPTSNYIFGNLHIHMQSIRQAFKKFLVWVLNYLREKQNSNYGESRDYFYIVLDTHNWNVTRQRTMHSRIKSP